MRNPTYEQVLEAQGCPWEYRENFELNSVDQKKSLANQARLKDALFPDEISQYRVRARAGDKFPPLVVHQIGKKRFEILDGNQRFEAFKPGDDWEGLTTHDAYVVLSDDPVVLNRIAWSFNNLVNGRRLSREEAIHHAITFVRKYGWTCQAAGREWGLDERTVFSALRLEEAKDKLREQGMERLPNDSIILKLLPLMALGDDVFGEAAKVIAESGASSEDAGDLVKRVKRSKTHAEKMATISEFYASGHIQERKAETKNGQSRKRTPMPRERFLRALRDLNSILQINRDCREVILPFQPDEREKALDLAEAVIGQLRAIFDIKREAAV